MYAFRRSERRVEFLMLRRSPSSRLGGTWQCVHGKIEPPERAWQAALRELREETGLTPIGFWQIDFVNTFYVASEDVVMHCPCFAAEIAPDAMVRLSDEHTEFAWAPMFERRGSGDAGDGDGWFAIEASFRRLMWPGQRTAVREIFAEIISRSAAEPHLRIPLS